MTTTAPTAKMNAGIRKGYANVAPTLSCHCTWTPRNQRIAASTKNSGGIA